MSSAKTERLVNLTMALLATQRYMRKSEIFRKVAGYSGNQETKERMFERDKDDLRALGIEIEVASHDPLFEDEPGYRIRPDSYRMPIHSFTSEEIGIITTALGLWLDSGFEELASGAARRFKSFDESNPIEIPTPFLSLEFSEEGLLDLSRALGQRSRVTFNYRKPDLQDPEARRVNPLGLSAWKGSWYLVGEDLDKEDIRVFKLARITSKIEIDKKRDSYEIPADFRVRDYLIMHSNAGFAITALALKDKAQSIRSKATSVVTPEDPDVALDWDRITFYSDDLETALYEALWHADCLVIESPLELKERVINSLQEVVEKHG
jgi:proteasome accessory factor B